MNGIETAKRIMDLDNTNCRGLQFIALTGDSDESTKKLFTQNGFSGFLSKPIDLIDLDDILKKLIPAEKQAEYVEKNDEAATPISSKVVIDGIDMDSNEIKSNILALKAFYDTWSKDLIKTHRALEANDLQGYTSYIHKLKGASGAIGATALFKDAERLEAAGKMKDQEVIDKCNPRLLSKLELLLSNIDDYLKAVDDDCVGATDTEVLKSDLTELKQAIYDYDFDIIGTVTEKIQPFERTENIGVAVKNILECIRGGKYGDTTIRLIDDILSSV
jgi:HPt (histidine-containing phosphotransfer) domain-containing protein